MKPFAKAVSVVAIWSLTVLAAQSAQAQSSDSGNRTVSTVPSKLEFRRRTVDDKVQLAPEEMLTDLRDARLALGQIKQQATNLFLEATRTTVQVTEPPLISSPTSISPEMLDEKKPYLPPRKEWLVFYVNSLEPLIHMLTDDIYDVDTNGRKVPASIEERINPLWLTWKQHIMDMQKSLEEIQGLIEPDSGTNIPLAKAAVSIFNHVNELEKSRYQAAVIFREEYKKQAEQTKDASPAH